MTMQTAWPRWRGAVELQHDHRPARPTEPAPRQDTDHEEAPHERLARGGAPSVDAGAVQLAAFQTAC